MRCLVSCAFLLSIAVIGPCTESRADQATTQSAQLLEPPIEGVLTNEGQQCPALRAGDGHLYTLTGDLHGFKPRDRVCVVPDYIDMTYCQQGTTAHVDWIGAGSCPQK
jgi:hypothetical protein